MAYIDATATHDGKGNVTLYGGTATHDNAGNVVLTITATETGAVIAEDEISLSLVDTSEEAKTATNFLYHDAANGLMIGDKSSGSWSGFRTQITSTAFNILNSTGEALASYGAKLIELGKNATDAVIKLCGGKGSIQVEVGDDGQSYLSMVSDYLRMRAEHAASIVSSWTNGSNEATKAALNVTENHVSIFAEDSYDLEDGVGMWRTSTFSVLPSEIHAYADNLVLGSRSHQWFNAASGGFNFSGDDMRITSYTAGLTDRSFGVNKVLASTTSFMHSGQYISFSEPISAQPNGAVFVWSLYSGGQAANTDFIYCFVPKSHVINHHGSGILMGSLSPWQHMAKYIYVRDTDCNGNDMNDDLPFSMGGVTISNNAYVLRYVIGV